MSAAVPEAARLTVEAVKALGLSADERVSVFAKRADTGATVKAARLTPGDLVAFMFGDLDGLNVWWGSCPMIDGPSRGGSADVVRVPALWADLDVKPGGLPSLDAAREVVDDLSRMLGSGPVLLVNSGHGLQPRWAVDDDDSRDVPAMAGIHRRFAALVRLVCRARGGSADSVSDLARVLRAPGSVNYKDPGHPVATSAEFPPGRPLSAAEITDALDDYDVPAADDLGDGGVKSDAGGWAWGATCGYVRRMVDGWAADSPDARHPWLMGQSVRLAAAHRLGCISEADHTRAVTVLRERFAELCARPGDTRAVGRGEVDRVLSWGVSLAELRDDDATRRELGNHAHTSTTSGPPPDAGEPADDDATAESGGKRGRAMRDRLADLAGEAFTLGRTPDGRAFLVETGGPNVALLAAEAKARLAAVARARWGVTPGRAALGEAWDALTGESLTVDPTPVPVRVASHNGAVVLDLGGADGRAVVADADGWQVVDRSPVTFRRSRATAVLPQPERGGSLAPLWELVNVPSEARAVVRAWLACCLIRDMPHPIVQVRGEQGAAKSTATSYLAELVDPSAALLLSPPGNAETWASSVGARWVLLVDNVSRIDPWWSDELCRTVTGAGSQRRALYSDDEVVARQLHAAVILNGISLASALRSDLAERLLPVTLVRPGAYRTEAGLRQHFARHHGTMLGAVLDDAVGVLAHLDEVTQPPDLRMADFARALAAFDLATGERTLAAYRAMHDEAAAEALDTDAVARAVLDWLTPGQEWRGKPAELLARLTSVREGLVNAHELDGTRDWPKDGARLTGWLTRSGPLLARHGVRWEHGRTNSGRWVRLVRAADDDTPGGGDATPGGDGGDGGDARSLLFATPTPTSRNREPKGESGTGDPERVRGATLETAASPASPSSHTGGGGWLTGSLGVCEVCGCQSVTSPCATCRAEAARRSEGAA